MCVAHGAVYGVVGMDVELKRSCLGQGCRRVRLQGCGGVPRGLCWLLRKVTRSWSTFFGGWQWEPSGSEVRKPTSIVNRTGGDIKLSK